MKLEKPMPRKCYGSIPHLRTSKFGRDDHGVDIGEERLFVEKLVDKFDTIVVTEKMDGSCVGVLKQNGDIIPIIRAGYRAENSKWKHHKQFYKWAIEKYENFDSILEEGEWVVGEWCGLAHGTLYKFEKNIEPFFIFDLFNTSIPNARLLYRDLFKRLEDTCFNTVPLLYIGNRSFSIHAAMKRLGQFGKHNADLSEGAVWRREDGKKCISLAKYVRPEKEIGRYLPEVSGEDEIWLWRNDTDDV